MRVSRKDNSLNDYIESLDERLIEAQRISKNPSDAVARAWGSLSSDELAFVDQEVDRCILDRRYFMENYYVIRDERGRLKALYPFFDHQELIMEAVDDEWDKKGCVRLIILKPRQAGSTTWNGALIFHDTIFVPNSYSLAMAQDDRVSGEIFQRMMDAYHNMPWFMRPEYVSKQQGLHVIFQRADENKRLTDPGLGSTLMVSNAQKSTGIAIGRTIKNLLASEVSRWPSAEAWTADIKPSMNAPDMLAIMESTAWGRNGLYYNMVRAAEAGKSIWRFLFIPVYKVRKYSLPIYKDEKFVLDPEEKALRLAVKKKENFVIPMGFFKWRRVEVVETINSTGSDETFCESFPVTSGEAFINSGLCAFPKKSLNDQERKHCRKPILIGEINWGGNIESEPELKLHEPTDDEIADKPEYINRFWVWEPPHENDSVEYYISADVASGDGGDYSAATIYRIGAGGEPDVQVAGWRGLINASHYAYVLASIGVWYRLPEIACEFTQSGITTCNELYRVIDYPNLYRYKRMDSLTHSNTNLMHWQTNSKTRPDAINRMYEALVDKTVELRDKHLIEEMRDFARYEGETKVAGIDNSDDMVMSAIIGLCALREKTRMSGMWSDNALATQTSQHVMPKVPVVFALFDAMNRQVQQVNSMAEGEQIIKDLSKKHGIDLSKHWRIVPITVMKANTIFSPAYDGSGAEHELYDKHGVDPRHQMPDLTYAFKQMLTHQSAGEYEDE